MMAMRFRLWEKFPQTETTDRGFIREPLLY
jgi:hypothetical protein